MLRQDFIWLICGAFGLNENQISVNDNGMFTIEVTIADTVIDSSKFQELVSRNISAVARVVLINTIGTITSD